MGLLPPGGRRSVSPLLSSSLFLPQDGSGRAAGYGTANAQARMERMACVFCRIRDGELPATPHFHIHLIPRWLGDGKGFDWTLVPAEPAGIRAAAGRIRATL